MLILSVRGQYRFGRRLVGAIAVVALALQMGCYSYHPLQLSVPTAGQRIAVLLNDRGRALVSDRLGSAIDKVDGLLVASGGQAITLEVYRTLDLRGSAASWTGERVEVPRDGIAGYQEREFSKRRTIILTAVVVGVIAVSILSVNLNLFSRFTRSDAGGGGPSSDSR
ncbi:MAG: hypothetical protein HYV19_04955 [Gemmatimonadetes bacterium]|nr:hypothetical protein [Gemmatimonadota bacterium]